MRWLLVPVVTAVVTIGCANQSGQGSSQGTSEPTSTPATEDVVATITGLEQQWVAAILAKDAATVERLLDENFVGTTDDVRYTRADAIDDVRSGDHASLEVTGLQVHVFGDTAVVTFDQAEKSKHGEEDFSGQYLFTNVWVKEGGTWRAVASHGARLR